jgi:hypothetical protein
MAMVEPNIDTTQRPAEIFVQYCISEGGISSPAKEGDGAVLYSHGLCTCGYPLMMGRMLVSSNHDGVGVINSE